MSLLEHPMRHRMSESSRGPSARWRPGRPAICSGAEPGHGQSGGLTVPGEGPGDEAQRGLQGRPMVTSDQGLA